MKAAPSTEPPVTHDDPALLEALEGCANELKRLGDNVDQLAIVTQSITDRLDRTEPVRIASDPTLADTLIAAFTGLGYALSARALLLLALIGAIIMAVRADNTASLVALAIYCLFTVGPVVILEMRKKG